VIGRVWIVCVATLLFVAPPAALNAAHAGRAAEILEQARAAAEGILGVRYTAVSTTSGVAATVGGPAEGSVVAFGWNHSIPQMFWTHLKTRRPGSDQPLELTAGGDGETYFIIDHGTRRGYEDIDPLVMGTLGDLVHGFGLTEFLRDAPYEAELDAERIELLGVETIEGEACHRVQVVFSGGQNRTVWYFATKDLLPRRRVQHFSIPGQGRGSIQVDILQLEVDPHVDPELFKLRLPDGYERVGDFAP